MRLRLTLLFLFGLATSSAQADWVNLTGAETSPNIAEISVSEDAVTVALEMYPRDVAVFEADGGPPLRILADGEELAGERLVREERRRVDRYSPYAGMTDPRTGRRMPSAPEDPTVLFVEWRYPLNDRPAALVFEPPVDDSGTARATIGFLLDHKSAPVVDFRYLSRAETLNLDWDDPWFTAFENFNLTRHHKWPQMSFLYVEPRVVRHEMLVRVRDVLGLLGQTPLEANALSAEELSELKVSAPEYFAGINPVRINENLTAPSRTRVEYLRIGSAGLEVIDPAETIDPSVAIMGLSQERWVTELPDTVTVDWQLFDDRVDQVPTNIIDPAGPFPGFVNPEFPVIEYTNYLKNYEDPVIKPVPAADDGVIDWTGMRMLVLGAPDEETANRAVTGLLGNIQVAFLEADPEQLDAQLALGLQTSSLEVQRSELARIFAIPTRGGGVAKVEAIGELSVSEIDGTAVDNGFRGLVEWTVAATGQHWGHIDQRRFRFRALMDVVRTDSEWRLAEISVLEARQL